MKQYDIFHPIRRKGAKEPVLKQNKEDELEYLTFPSIEETELVEHMVTSRLGGASKGDCASLNFSFTRGDDPEAVFENYRRAAAILKAELSDFVCSHQTHTANVKAVTKKDAGKGLTKERDYSDIDGFITNEPGLVLSCFFADCVPILFLDPVKKAIGLCHSGWRGTVQQIAKVTVEAMRKSFGSRPEDIIAAIAPSICQDCYEVSEDVAEKFRALVKSLNLNTEDTERQKEDVLTDQILLDKKNGKYQLNLWKANELILLDAGLLKENISVTDICTCCNPAYLFSHRATGGKRGNMAVFLKLKKY